MRDKALRGNPKPRIFPDRTETGSGIFFELFSGSVRSGKNIIGVDRVGEKLLGVGESLHSVRETQMSFGVKIKWAAINRCVYNVIIFV